MKACSLIQVLIVSIHILAVLGVAFHRGHSIFGVITRGGSGETKQPEEHEEQYKRAQRLVLQGIAHVESDIQKAVKQEVDTLFHGLDDGSKNAAAASTKEKKKEIHKRAKQAVKQGVQKAKRHVDEHTMDADGTYPFEIHNPYEWPSHKNGDPGLLAKIADSRVLHAVEAAERAVVKAVQDEVDTLFHDEPEHHHEQETKKAVTKGVEISKKQVEETHSSRRKFLLDAGELGLVEDYMRFSME